ncbi:MAG TPA: 2-amino-4-hydroxy-6-hydroxymethyldihydropteridine pyrophosphokinase [Lachnospiraceae bacterium]|nr:2-amino-4-hydroxy-6-hydroxymethyldihydropteridine pyrophosphokinase [Lachnospiraceae bacterium]
MDYITISNLEVFGYHGVYEEEKKLGQKFLVSARLGLDLKFAGEDDDISESVHYGKVCRLIHDHMKEHTYHLIEAAAENLAEEILLTYGRVRNVSIEVKKPWAPIGIPLEAVSVTIERSWHDVYISLGSNLGDREEHINAALWAMEQNRAVQVKVVSEYVESDPYGGVEQDTFVNAAAKIRTLLSPEELLMFLHETEDNEDRQRTVRWGPRTLDLDILMYDDLILDTEQLTIPHEDMHNRDFVLAPLAEIAPRLRHPVLNKTVSELLAGLEKTYIRK